MATFLTKVTLSLSVFIFLAQTVVTDPKPLSDSGLCGPDNGDQECWWLFGNCCKTSHPIPFIFQVRHYKLVLPLLELELAKVVTHSSTSE